MPVYNAASYLARAVDSVLAQTFRDFELILVDDGSTDSSDKICDEYAKKDERIRVIHQENRGISGAKLTGVQAVRGEYIGFVDNDDYILPGRFERMYSAIVESKADMVCAGCFKIHDYDLTSPLPANEQEYVDLWRDVLVIRGYSRDETISIKAFIHLYFHEVRLAPLWELVIRKNRLLPAYFKQGLNRCEDEYFWLSIFEQNQNLSIHTITDHTYIHILRDDSTRTNPELYNDWLMVMNKKIEFLLKAGLNVSLRTCYWQVANRILSGEIDTSKKGPIKADLIRETYSQLRKTPYRYVKRDSVLLVRLGHLFFHMTPTGYKLVQRVLHGQRGK